MEFIIIIFIFFFIFFHFLIMFSQSFLIFYCFIISLFSILFCLFFYSLYVTKPTEESFKDEMTKLAKIIEEETKLNKKKLPSSNIMIAK